ncbi:MAG TPA: hypothetical protein VKI62_10050 [Bacteroidota bacterium]|nr:hypothetical protein [Bacteroidota bacterium]
MIGKNRKEQFQLDREWIQKPNLHDNIRIDFGFVNQCRVGISYAVLVIPTHAILFAHETDRLKPLHRQRGQRLKKNTSISLLFGTHIAKILA